jgi:hypothetical protein
MNSGEEGLSPDDEVSNLDDSSDGENDSGIDSVADRKPRAKPSNQRQPLKGKKSNSNTACVMGTAFPGTLLFLSEEAKGDDALDGTAAAAHINRWTDIIDSGDHALERALSKERSHLKRLPIVFGFVEPDSNQIQLAHGFEEITMDTEYHDADGRIGFFLGDRIITRIDNVAQQHDPPFCTVANFGKVTTQFHGKSATAAACAKATRHLLPGDEKAKIVDVNKIFPIPMLWWSFFLAKARTPMEAYRWISSVTCTWLVAGEKTAATTARQWIRAACTQSLEAATSSGVAITVRPAPRDTHVVQWASSSLSRYLPHPKPFPGNNQQHRAATIVPSPPDNHSATLHQAMVLAQDVLKSAVE